MAVLKQSLMHQHLLGGGALRGGDLGGGALKRRPPCGPALKGGIHCGGALRGGPSSGAALKAGPSCGGAFKGGVRAGAFSPPWLGADANCWHVGGAFCETLLITTSEFCIDIKELHLRDSIVCSWCLWTGVTTTGRIVGQKDFAGKGFQKG